MSKCVVCKQEISKNHRCPPKVEAGWQAAQTKANNEENGEYETKQASESLRLYLARSMYNKGNKGETMSAIQHAIKNIHNCILTAYAEFNGQHGVKDQLYDYMREEFIDELQSLGWENDFAHDMAINLLNKYTEPDYCGPHNRSFVLPVRDDVECELLILLDEYFRFVPCYS